MAKIFIYSPNHVGNAMAGPSIRAWEFATALSNDHNVFLITPNDSESKSDKFKIVAKTNPSLKELEKDADVMIVQGLTLSKAIQAKRNHTRIIIDAYDPLPLEILEQFKHSSAKEKQENYASVLSNLNFNFMMADSIICASEKQRDLWLGLLLGQGLINPQLYEKDNTLRSYIDVVPFGLSEIPPEKNGPGFREKYKIRATDKVLIWGGGIWNWFDPLTIIRAIKHIHQTRDDIKLVFMGIKNPDPSVPEMAMASKAIELSKELGLYDKQVFFNHGWIPYEERQNHLLEADIGVSTHFDHLETRFSFRTRMLDYIWAELPILATQGDSFAELIHQNHLGAVIPYQNSVATAESIIDMLNSEQMKNSRSALRRMKSQFYWNHVVEPIRQMIDQFSNDKPQGLTFNQVRTCSNFFWQKVQEKGLKKCLQKAFN